MEGQGAKLYVQVVEATHLKVQEGEIYCELRVKDSTLFYQTSPLNAHGPLKWSDEFIFNGFEPKRDVLLVKFYKKARGVNQLLGGLELPIAPLMISGHHELNGWYDLWENTLTKQKGEGSVNLAFRYDGPDLISPHALTAKVNSATGMAKDEYYCKIEMVNTRHLEKTARSPKTSSPVWDYTFNAVVVAADRLRITVMEKTLLGGEDVHVVLEVPLDDVLRGPGTAEQTQWPLVKKGKTLGSLSMTITHESLAEPKVVVKRYPDVLPGFRVLADCVVNWKH